MFIGLLLAALGGFGTFHFGQRAARRDDGQRTATMQTLAEVVNALRDEQSGLLARVTVVETKVAEPPTSLLAAAPTSSPPPAMFFPVVSSPSAAAPAVLPLAPAPAPAMPDVLRPHLPPIASGPGPTEEEEAPTAALKPSKSPFPTAPATGPTVAAREEDGPLTFQKRLRLIKRLRSHPQHSIVIRAAAENAQAVKLAIMLKTVFREAGWTVGEIEMVSRPLPAHTLLLSTGVFPPPKEFVAAYAALAGTGFLVTSDLDPNQGKERVVVSVGPIR